MTGKSMCQQSYIDPGALQCYSMERQRRTCKLRRIKIVDFPPRLKSYTANVNWKRCNFRCSVNNKMRSRRESSLQLKTLKYGCVKRKTRFGRLEAYLSVQQRGSAGAVLLYGEKTKSRPERNQ
jgi:hypothetical protein